jgi:hypothetical protein
MQENTPSSTATTKSSINIEEVIDANDKKFILEYLEPYLKNIFNDLCIRFPQMNLKVKLMDKTTFLEYCQLPTILGERLFSELNIGF